MDILGHHSSFLSPNAVTKFQGEPLSGGDKCMGLENFANIAISQERYEMGPYGTLIGSHR